MDGKTAVQPRFVWLIQFSTAVAIILWAVTGRAQDYERQVEFSRLVDEQLTPRTVPATVTTEEESALAGKGYVKIGTIGGSLPGTDAKTMKDQILAKAADAGGDLVRLDQDGVSVQLSLSKDKEKRTNCLNWETSTYTTTEKSKEVCYKDEHGYSHCNGGNNYEARHTRRTCTQWDYKKVTSLKTVPGLSSEGTVWRRDPNLADDVALRAISS
jgi:hypothetical protein